MDKTNFSDTDFLSGKANGKCFEVIKNIEVMVIGYKKPSITNHIFYLPGLPTIILLKGFALHIEETARDNQWRQLCLAKMKLHENVRSFYIIFSPVGLSKYLTHLPDTKCTELHRVIEIIYPTRE